MFGQDELNRTILAHLNQPDVVPAGKKIAIVAHRHEDGTVQGAVAFRVGQHWQVGGDAEIHDGKVDVGTSVMASW